MTHQVALSKEAYAALKREKGSGESFSHLVLRLMREARLHSKDPMAFVNFPHKFTMSMEEHLRLVEEMRDADRVEPWWLEKKDGSRTGEP